VVEMRTGEEIREKLKEMEEVLQLKKRLRYNMSYWYTDGWVDALRWVLGEKSDTP